MRVMPDPAPPASSTVLGDWYATLLPVRPSAILCMSERTFLPVIIPGKNAAAFVDTLRILLPEVLQALGVHAEAIEKELAAMHPVHVSSSKSRTHTGMLTNLSYFAEMHVRDGLSWRDASLKVANVPCSPAEFHFPDLATVAAFKRVGGIGR